MLYTLQKREFCMRTPLNKDELINLVSDCIGCAACANACPKQCIQLRNDNDDFLKPFIDSEKCIGCRVCVSICPVLNQERRRMMQKRRDSMETPQFMYGWNRNSEMRRNSSSGGFFTSLAEYILSKGGCVFGVSMKGMNQPVMKMAETPADLESIRGSKYLQAKVGNSYREAREQLKKGRLVLFTGTPCQIGGLYSFLNDRPDNLITADIICHGVPSYLLMKKYISYLRLQGYGSSKPTSIFFRDKRNGWKHNRFGMRISWADNREFYMENGQDLFLKGFLYDKILNRGCYSCKYVGMENRMADFTMADAWEIWQYYPELDCRDGISTIVCLTRKANDLMPKLRDFEYHPAQPDITLKHNWALIHSRPMPSDRDKALNSLKKEDFTDFIKKYASPPQRKTKLRIKRFWQRARGKILTIMGLLPTK